MDLAHKAGDVATAGGNHAYGRRGLIDDELLISSVITQAVLLNSFISMIHTVGMYVGMDGHMMLTEC